MVDFNFRLNASAVRGIEPAIPRKETWLLYGCKLLKLARRRNLNRHFITIVKIQLAYTTMAFLRPVGANAEYWPTSEGIVAALDSCLESTCVYDRSEHDNSAKKVPLYNQQISFTFNNIEWK